jgi:hypothetical protein
MPSAMRMRAFADLRTEAGRGRTRLPWLMPVVSAVASTTALLAICAAFLVALLSGGLASPAGAPVSPWPAQTAVPATSSGSVGGAPDTAWFALILVVAALAGGAVRLPPVRRAGRWLAGVGQVAEPVAAFPRRLRDVSPMAIGLSAVLGADVLLPYHAYGAVDLGFVISTFLPSALAPAIALRYSRADRSGRWLLVGGVAIATAPLPGLALAEAGYTGLLFSNDWGAILSTVVPYVTLTLEALGWLAMAAGIASRSGIGPRPGWVVAASATSLVLYVQLSLAVQFMGTAADAGIALPPEDLVRLAYQTLANCLMNLALLSILWVALWRLRRNGAHGAWRFAMLAAAVQAGWLVCAALASPGLREWPGAWILAPQWIAASALLLGLLLGLEPVRPEPPPGSQDPAEAS